MNNRIRFNNAVIEIIDTVEACHEFTITYEEKSYTVLGGLVGVGISEQLCLWADVLAIDGQEQTKPAMKVFYIEGIQTRVHRGKLWTGTYSDYTKILQGLHYFYARGPILARKSPQAAQTADKNEWIFVDPKEKTP